MLIIFGTNSSSLHPINYKSDEACPNCNQARNLFIKPQYTYFHIFWIPMIATSTKHKLECYHCKNVYSFVNLPSQIRFKAIEQMSKDKVKRPVWNSLGCLFIGVFILFSFISFVIILLKSILK